jgi:hypothetical protein
VLAIGESWAVRSVFEAGCKSRLRGLMIVRGPPRVAAEWQLTNGVGLA